METVSDGNDSLSFSSFERGNSFHGHSGNQNFGNDGFSHAGLNDAQSLDNSLNPLVFGITSVSSEIRVLEDGRNVSFTIFEQRFTFNSFQSSEFVESIDVIEGQNTSGMNEAANPAVAPADGSANNLDSISAAPADLQNVSSPAAETSSDPTSPAQFVISLSPTSTDGTMFSAQPPTAIDQHILSEVTLAAISVMGSQGMASQPAAPSSSGVYSFSISAFDLPVISRNHEQVSVMSNAKAITVDAPTNIGQTEPSVEVHLPAGETVAGTIGDSEGGALDASMSHVLDSISSLSVELTEDLGQTNMYGWVSAAGLLTLGAGYTVWKNQKLQRAVRFPLGRGSMGSWQGEEHDVGGR
jgi:hypothetical protein